MLFRTQENVPEIYVNKSRDFQLLCRLKDVLFGGVKYTIDSLNHTSNTLEMNATLLPLLKSKVGFFEYEELTEDELRYLLAGFPALIRYKGSKRAIEKAVYLWFRVNRMSGKLLSIDIDNANHYINIYIDSKDADTKLLNELFKYILPAGYQVSYSFATHFNESSNYLFNDDKLEGINVHNKYNSNIWDTKDDETTITKRLKNSVGLAEIMDIDDITGSGTTDVKEISSKDE